MPVSRIRYLLFPAILYAVISLACTQIPLLNYLGYEFSVVIAIAASCASGVLTVWIVRERYAADSDDAVERIRSALSSLRSTVTYCSALLVVPLVIMAGNALFVKNCSLLEGVGFYLVLALVSTLFSCCAAFFLAVQYRHATIIFFLFLAGTVLYALGLGYYTPAIFSYNLFYGYFPGLTYDEVVPLSRTLVLFRFLTVATGVLFVWMGVLVARHIPRAAKGWRKTFILAKILVRPRYRRPSLLIALSLGLLFAYRCDLGFETTSSYLRQVLESKFTTRHFVIHYVPGSFTDEEIRQLGAEHEFRLGQIMEEFALRRTDPMESFVYPSVDLKRRLIGAGSTNIAKPWSRQMHITRGALWGSLKHEMVHVVAGVFGRRIIRASLSTGLVEGLATAVAHGWGNRTVHQYAAALHKFDLAPDITALMSFAGFASQAPSVSYILAGSFCRYLIDRYGIRKIVLLYKSEDYSGVYGRTLAELVTEWRGYLERFPVGESERGVVDVLFRDPPIFEKVCARVVAERNAGARGAFGRGEYALAESLYQISYDEAGGYGAFAGYVSSLFSQGRFDSVTAAYERVVVGSARPLQYLRLFLVFGDAFWIQGETEKAKELYSSVRTRNIANSSAEAAALRLMILHQTPNGEPLPAILHTVSTDSMRLSMLDSVANRVPANLSAAYMRGVIVQRMGKDEAALQMFRGMDLAGEDSLLQALRLRRMGVALFHMKRYSDAKAEFWSSLNYDSGVMMRHRVEDWIDRCEWMAQHGD
jgi:tetratricopeptide (TPR) repeat protein